MKQPGRVVELREDNESSKRRKPSDAGTVGLQERRSQLAAERRRLPVYSARAKLVELVRSHDAIVIVGETGSGKTTQIPQFLDQAGFGTVVCTQPRRVAAVTVARRVAEEMGTRLGDKVGYTIRFDDTTSAATRIKYMTDGMLLREALLDPLLSRYKVVILDEAHERTVNTDVLLGLLKGILARCKPGSFKLVVMSATLEAAKFVQYLPGAHAALVHGRTFPVQVMYTAQPEENYLDAALCAVLQVHVDEGPGDILVFLTGQDEIESLERLLLDRVASLRLPAGRAEDAPSELLVLPIYAALPPEQQMKVFEPAGPGQRKAILATNIAETSITISGVRYVIDTGFVKARAYNAAHGADSLQVRRRAQARQRSGRAGREGPGKAFRLYPEAAFRSLPPNTLPELLRANLGSVVLQLKALGVQDVLGFDFIDAPPRAAILRSLELLYALGALDRQGQLTPEVGLPLARMPVDPMYAKVLLAAAAMGCAVEAMQVVALISTDGVFVQPRSKRDEAAAARVKFTAREGDHLTLLAVGRAYAQLPRKQQASWCHDNFLSGRALNKAQDIFLQLERHMRQLGLAVASCGEDCTPLRKALTAGLFPHAARLQPGGAYKVIATGQTVYLHPSSVLVGRTKPDCVVFNELVRTTKQYARVLTAIEVRWLPELCPAYFAAKAGQGVEAAG
ncbi:hypothetical protein QJQ45_001401 [Haematococcus lacustris]|nr:hypothetical protein QJQ45_001401 [Haematococcus lacustris]